MEYIAILLGIATMQFVAAASPGPNFILVTNYTLSKSRLSGLLVACGILLASLTWALLAAGGLGVFLSRFPTIYNILQLVSAGYLVWLGLKVLLGVWRSRSSTLAQREPPALSNWQAVRAGFITNMTNPKSVAYYSSLFLVMVPSDAPSWLLAAAVGVAFSVSAIWWTSVPLLFATGPVRSCYERIRHVIDTVMGALLIGLGMRLVLAR
jgi:threonine efflux protein